MDIIRSHGENGLSFWTKLLSLVMLMGAVYFGAFTIAARRMDLMNADAHEKDIEQVEKNVGQVEHHVDSLEIELEDWQDRVEGLMVCLYYDIPEERCRAAPPRSSIVPADSPR